MLPGDGGGPRADRPLLDGTGGGAPTIDGEDGGPRLAGGGAPRCGSAGAGAPLRLARLDVGTGGGASSSPRPGSPGDATGTGAGPRLTPGAGPVCVVRRLTGGGASLAGPTKPDK